MKRKMTARLLTFTFVLSLFAATPLTAQAASAPILQSAATSTDGTTVTLTFDKAMSDPTTNITQFSVLVGGISDTVTYAALSAGDSKKIDLTLTNAVMNGQTVTASYTAGSVTSADGGMLAAFADQPVTTNGPTAVAQVGVWQFEVLSSALTAVSDGGTIKLLADIPNYTSQIEANGKSYTIDLNSHALGVVINIPGDSAVSAYPENRVLTVTGGGSFTVQNSSQDGIGMKTTTAGSQITIDPSVAVTVTAGDIGIMAAPGSISFSGNITAGNKGIYAGIAGGTVALNGNIITTKDSSYGIYSMLNGVVQVNGNITVSGAYSYGTYATDSAAVTVSGNVTSSSIGAAVSSGGTITVEGNMATDDDYYIGIYGNFMSKSAYDNVTTKSGYLTYSGDNGYGLSTVWVKAAIVTSIAAGTTSLTASGGTSYITVSGTNLTDGLTVTAFLSGTATSVTGTTTGSSTTQTVTLTFPANSGSSDKTYTVKDSLDSGTSWNSNTATVVVSKPAPAITGVSAGTAMLTSSGGTSVIIVTGTNLTDGITVSAILGGTATSVTGTTIGSATSQTVTLTFPANTGSDNLSYTVKASFNLGTTWEAKTATVNVSKTEPSSAGGVAADEGKKITVTTTEGSCSVSGTLTQNDSGTQVVIKNNAFDKLNSADLPASVNAQLATVVFDKKAMDTIGAAAGSGDVILKLRKVAASELSESGRRLIGSRPVYDLAITGGATRVSDFGGGRATVAIPYIPLTGESINTIVVYYLSDSGMLTAMRGRYDSLLKAVVFVTGHFSVFAVGYNPVTFSDVAASNWYSDAVTFIAARGVTSGTSDDTFDPDNTLTRAQFVVMLMRAYNIAPDATPTDNFTDAGNTYYTGYLSTAKRLGISGGVGDNMFAPENTITRQELFTLLYNTLKVIGELPKSNSGKKLSDYSDASGIATWAADAMTLLVESGIISGSGEKLSPTDTTTRAEMVQVLYNLLAR